LPRPGPAAGSTCVGAVEVDAGEASTDDVSVATVVFDASEVGIEEVVVVVVVDGAVVVGAVVVDDGASEVDDDVVVVGGGEVGSGDVGISAASRTQNSKCQ
jgi:hypothetical protein